MADYDITNLLITPSNKLSLLTWTSPDTYGAGPITFDFQHVHIRYREDIHPVNANDGTYVSNVSGSGGKHQVHLPLTNGQPYYYSLFSVYQPDTPPGASLVYRGPYHEEGAITPSSGSQIFSEVSSSFSHLELNTRLFSKVQKYNVADVIVWLPVGQIEKKPVIIDALNLVKPAYTILRIRWELYYTAQTTTEHLTSGSFDATVYVVENGTLINAVPTVDASFSGDIDL